MTLVKILLGTANGWLAAIIAGFVAFTAYSKVQRNIGAEKAVAKIEKANRNATRKGNRAARKSRSGSVRGIPDPITRD